MAIPSSYSFTRYLAAKKSIDDRALNRHVWGSLGRTLANLPSATPPHVLEVGAGIGTMLERMLDWGLLAHAAYTGIDADAENIFEGYRRLPIWAERLGLRVSESQGLVCLQGEERQVAIELQAAEFFDFAARECGHRLWDVLVAHAFMDLMDIPRVLPPLFSLLKPGGLFYFTIVFDGATILQPEIDPAYDALVETLYHETMDRRSIADKPSGDSRTGRHLFGHLQTAGAELLDAGGSDWVVFAGSQGYPADEAYFLHYIIHTIHTELHGHPELANSRFANWIARRHAQVEEGSLVYIAYQLDFLGRVNKLQDAT